MRSRFPLSAEFIFSLFALILSFFIVHGAYMGWVRPAAEDFMAAEKERRIAEPESEEQRSIYVMVKDFEQEACFILFFWALAMIFYKSTVGMREKSLLGRDIVSITEGMRIRQSDARDLSREILSLPRSTQRLLVPRAMLAALHRFASTGNIQDVSDATHAVCNAEADRMDSELSMIRYIAWAIPSIGFIGTVRGIGQGLAKADAATKNNDISPVTEALGVAFNSTLVALFISIVLMFLVHQLQLLQERLALDAENYCNESLLRHMYTD